MKKYTSGCLDDNRLIEDKEKDYMAEEIVAFSGVDIPEIDYKDIPHYKIDGFKIRNQASSGSCVAQTLANMIAIEVYRQTGVWHDLSASFIYQRRSNKGTMGMIGVDAMNIAKNDGTIFDNLMPSQNMGESAINSVPEAIHYAKIAKAFAGFGFAFLPFNIDKIAEIQLKDIKRGIPKPIMTWYRFPRPEWNSEPKAGNSKTDIVHHSVTAIIPGKRKGVKGLYTVDSWGHDRTTEKGMRFISEDYITKRMTFCAYLDDFNTKWIGNDQVPDLLKPKTKLLSRTLRMGMEGEDVKELQTILKYDEKFPQKSNITGYFGSVTRKAVIQFQKENNLEADGICGPNTIKKLKEKFN